MSLYQELRRRNVIRVAAAYTVAAWLVVQVAETVYPLFGFGDAPARIVVVVVAIGFVPAIIISWAFEFTPEGLKRDADVDREYSSTSYANKKLDRIIIAVLVVALVYFAFDKFVLDPQRDIDMTETAARTGAEQARDEARLDMFSDKSIAVLPFANRSEQKDDEYFTDGMHDELLTRLSRISALKVISRTSMMKYRDTKKTIPEIGQELSVATVLEGGVQRSGNQVRINVQLIDARTDEHLWAEIFDRELTTENLFAIQSEISTAIANSLKATLSPEERTRVYDLPTSSLEAYNHYLRGRQSMALRTREGLQEALAEFEQAADIDPEFALAWVGIGDSVHLLKESDGFDSAEAFERHKMAVEKALVLNNQLAEAYTSMAFVYVDRGEREKAVAAFEKSIELNPNYAQTYHWYAIILEGNDKDEKLLPLLYKAAQLDPLSSVIQTYIAFALYQRGRADEALEALNRVLERDPNFARARRMLGGVEKYVGHLASAIGHIRKAIELDPGNWGSRYMLAEVYTALGDFEAVGGVLADIEASLGRASYYYGITAYGEQIARGNYQDAIAILQALPEEFQQRPDVSFSYARAYLLAEDYQMARDYAFERYPFFADPDLWQQEVTEKNISDCEIAGAIHEAGDDIGLDLIRLFIRNYEARLSNNKPVVGQSRHMITCYLVEGAYQEALDLMDRETANGHLTAEWWIYRQLPWWKPLEDDPRYLELVKRNEGLLDQQRALLK
jgi:TolB-like protein/Tfp pilus assembly protein PilF